MLPGPPSATREFPHGDELALFAERAVKAPIMQRPGAMASLDHLGRRVLGEKGAHLAPESCEQTNAYRWLSVDFGESKDNDACAVSQ